MVTHSIRWGLKCLTCDYHHADGEYLLIICFCGHISKANARHTCHGEVQCSDIHRFAGWSVDELRQVGVIGQGIRVRRLRHIGQFPQPRILEPIISIRASYRVPDARKPMRNKHIEAEQQYQHGSTVFQIAVQLSYYATQT